MSRTYTKKTIAERAKERSIEAKKKVFERDNKLATEKGWKSWNEFVLCRFSMTDKHTYLPLHDYENNKLYFPQEEKILKELWRGFVVPENELTIYAAIAMRLVDIPTKSECDHSLCECNYN